MGERMTVRAATPAPAERATAAGPAAPPRVADVLALQRSIGNAATRRVLARAPTAAERDATAAAIISGQTSWGNLDEAGLGAKLLAMLETDPVAVSDVFDALGSTDRDDVALELAKAASDEQLARIAGTTRGREGLRRVVRELLSGWSSDEENAQMRRLMGIISDHVPQVDDGKGGKTIEIQVVTFDKGGAVMDWLGENAAGPVWWAMGWRSDDRRNQFGEGARGHTAIIVGDLAYSYEGTGWRVGQSAKEYMTDACKDRPATAQVLLLPIEDAKKIKAHLDRAANTGVYLLGGEICSDATGTALEQALGTLTKNANPQSLKRQLAASGKVSSERWYAKGSKGVPQKKPD